MNSVLIFDYDGVIVDSLDMFMNFFIEACQTEGWEQISSEQSFLALFNGNMYENMFQLGMTKQNILDIVNRVKKGLLSNIEKTKIFPQIKEALQQLQQDHSLLISTSNDTQVVQQVLKYHDINYFQEIYGSDKNHSKVQKIHMIKEKYPAKNYAYIGDTVGDIIEGKKAHIQTIAVTWGWHQEKQLIKEKPDHIIHSPDQLVEIMK